MKYLSNAYSNTKIRSLNAEILAVKDEGPKQNTSKIETLIFTNSKFKLSRLLKVTITLTLTILYYCSPANSLQNELSRVKIHQELTEILNFKNNKYIF